MSIGNIDSALSAVQESSVPSEVSLKLLGNALDQTQDMGNSMVRMMEQSVNPHIGGNVDLSL